MGFSLDTMRKLSAILAADIVGFSALVSRNENRALQAFNGHISALKPIIGGHSGRLFKATGDGFLVDFGSVVDAVSCAVAMQGRIRERNADEPPDDRLAFRMGVHVGDVVVDDEDLLGDGVNIAVRLESIARPGGVTISDRVFFDVENKLDVDFRDGGVVSLKNIPRPIRVYEIAVEEQEPRRVVLERPEKPSLAVLPFINLSADLEQEYFVDGLTEDLITALSSVPWIFVIARNSSFTFKGLTTDVRKIGDELGVQYVLEGSVRRSGNRLRVSGQLVDTETGTHLWADRFDGVLEDMFDLQDEITRAVVGAIGPKIQSAEIERAVSKRPDSLTAYDFYLRARAALNAIQIGEAAKLLEQSIAASPGFAKAKAVRSWCYTLYGWHGDRALQGQTETAVALAEEALRSPNADFETAAYAGYTISFMTSEGARGLRLLEDVTRQCPSFSWAWSSLALLEFFFRDAERAIELGRIAQRLNPRDPQNFRAEMALCVAFLKLGRFEECLEVAEHALQNNPNIPSFTWRRITCLVELGRFEEAQAVTSRFLARNPDFRLSRWQEKHLRKNLGTRVVELTENALRRMGVPE